MQMKLAEVVDAVLPYETMIVFQRYLPFHLPFANECNSLKVHANMLEDTFGRVSASSNVAALQDDLNGDVSHG